MKKGNHQHEYKSYGELEYCSKCMGLKGSTPTDCPGEDMTEEQSDGVCAGHLDYSSADGWKETLSPMGINRVTSHYYKVARKLSGHENTSMEVIYEKYPLSLHSEVFKLLQKLADGDRGLTTYRA